MEPISNYLVATEGNPRWLSAVAHLGNLVPNTIDRPAYNSNGTPVIDRSTGIQDKCLKGSPRAHFPIREDTKSIIRKVIDQLQVAKRADQPVKFVRYPQEEGELKSNLQNERIKWLMDGLNHSRIESKHLAMEELENLFQPDCDAIDEQDPLGTLSKVKN